jgi:hypothetical protein
VGIERKLLEIDKAALTRKVVNSVPFRPEWSKHFIPIQKMKQNGTNLISF